MKLYHKSAGVKVLHAECLEMLRKLPDNSIDSIVTDPPYGLSNTTPKHVLEAMTAWIGGDREFIPATSGGFMGKSWDNFVPPPAVWDEALRVLKPGGHLLCFAGTRTQDLMGMSIRLAGFDIRDSIAWMYGSGFPKGQDIGKVIDKAAGATREVVGPSRRHAGSTKDHGAVSDLSRFGTSGDMETAPATEEAKQWTGWNNALKPAFEPIIMAQKPFKGALFRNVMEQGVGALNIDATRIPGEPIELHIRTSNVTTASSMSGESTGSTGTGEYSTAGRYPANVILDESQAAALDEQSGYQKDGVATNRNRAGEKPNAIYGGGWNNLTADEGYGGGGGASRFFYCAKTPKKERPMVEGKGHPTVKPLALMRYLVKLVTPPNGLILEPFAGSGSTVEAALLEGFRVIASEREEEYLPLIVQRIERINLPEDAVA